MYVERTSNHDLPLPTHETISSAGMDLRVCSDTPINIEPGETVLVPTGFRWAIPEGSVGLVCPRSGLALNYGITVLNGPGVVDSDYRGEVKVILINHSDQPFTIAHGDRIAQMVVTSFTALSPLESDEPLNPTERGEGGFGHTGTE